MSDRQRWIDEFYGLLAEVGQLCGGTRRLAECSGASGWPSRGVYFFFEAGEVRADGSPRVVRIGTHALRPSSSTLWKRLSQHKGNAGGSRPGGGNHRGSIFRLHVGNALLATSEWPDDVRRTWPDRQAPRDVRPAEYGLERAVSQYIGAMPFVWLPVDDEPSAASDRGVIEAGAISLLSNLGRDPINPPSPTWLGGQCGRPLVAGSGLWNVNHVQDPASPAFLAVLAKWVEQA